MCGMRRDVDGMNSVAFFFFQAEDGIRDDLVTGVQTCALPICGAQIMGSGSRDGVSAAMAARSDAARSGLAARNCRNLRRLVAWSSIGIGVPPSGPNHRRALKARSEERRVGKEGRSRWSPYHLK